MALKFYKPTTPGRRHASAEGFKDVTKHKPEKRLRWFRAQKSGRNAQGKITVRHRGGGARRFVRIVDFIRDRYDEPAKVTAIEYDPSRIEVHRRMATAYFADV